MIQDFRRRTLRRKKVALLAALCVCGIAATLLHTVPSFVTAGEDRFFRLISTGDDRQPVANAIGSNSDDSADDVVPRPKLLDRRSLKSAEPDIYSSDSSLDGDPPPDLPDRPVNESKIFSPQYYQNVESSDPEVLDELTSRHAEAPFEETPWLFERPEWQSGWWATVDASIVKPTVFAGLNSGNLLSVGNPVQLPFAPLHWTVSPTVRIGYRPTRGRAGFAVSYRGLFSDGTATIAAFDAAGSGNVYSRVSINVIDADAVFSETVDRLPVWLPSLLECYFGVRTVGSQFVSSASGQQILSARESNQFVGAGLHASFKVEWPIAASPWSVFAKGDFGGLYGQGRQDFSQTIAGGPPNSASASLLSNSSITMINAQFGATYVPSGFHRQLQLSGAYEYERWLTIGTTDSSMDFQFQGFMLRSNWSF